MPHPRPSLADILAAQRTIAGIAMQTPLVASELAPDPATPLWLKLETIQPTGAFKIRGAANALAKLSAAQRKRGVVCGSTGNHGRALAYAGRQLGVGVTVCLSHLVPQTKAKAIAALGGTVITAGDSQDQAQQEVERLAADEGLIEISAFDHFHVLAGQGTIAVEILQAKPDIQTLLVPLSGGGLISGIALAAKAINPSIRIIGLCMDRGAAMAESLQAGAPVEVPERPSLADCLGGGIGGANKYTFPICQELVDEVILLTEDEIYRGLRTLILKDRLIAEGGAAVSHAAILAGKVRLTGPTAAILSGRNISPARLTNIVAGEPIHLGGLTVTGG